MKIYTFIKNYIKFMKDEYKIFVNSIKLDLLAPYIRAIRIVLLLFLLIFLQIQNRLISGTHFGRLTNLHC